MEAFSQADPSPARLPPGASVETFRRRADGTILRIVRAESKTIITELGSAVDNQALDAAGDQLTLRAHKRRIPAEGPAMRTADLFSGCGGLTLGLEDAAAALDRRHEPVFAVERARAPAAIYQTNFPESRVLQADAGRVFGRMGAGLTRAERAVVGVATCLEWLAAGPPCQGYSSLNHKTRGSDDRNPLYGLVARAAEVLHPESVLIENVPTASSDTSRIVEQTAESLARLGYAVDQRVVNLGRLGVPQERRRHVLIATLRPLAVDLAGMEAAFTRPRRSVEWAIRDLVRSAGRRPFDAASRPTPDNRRRMAYLQRHGAYDLPNSRRPPCHQDERHSYNSMYGRLSWDRPAQTVTSGYGSMGQGRYVHPLGRRTLTPHEAARLQMFPDWFDFGNLTRTAWADAIGNAAPMKLSYVAALWLSRSPG